MTRPTIIDVNSLQGLLGLGPIPSRAPVAAINPGLTESLVETKSIEAYHYRSMPNPQRETVIGPIDPGTQISNQRGFIYYKPRKMGVVPQNISLESKLQVQALYDVGRIVLNVTGHYFCGDREHVQLRPYDIVVLNPTITTMTSQLFEYNPTGPQKLVHRVLGVDILVDTDLVVYNDGTDFCVSGGMIHWLKGKRPKNGSVMSCVYYINPIYIVENVPHNLRITPGNSTGDGRLPREGVYAPQLVICKSSDTMQEADLVKYDLFNLPSYGNTPNVTGGST